MSAEYDVHRHRRWLGAIVAGAGRSAAKSIRGLNIPESILAVSDEVIE
jgi:hypothetical protein